MKIWSSRKNFSLKTLQDAKEFIAQFNEKLEKLNKNMAEPKDFAQVLVTTKEDLNLLEEKFFENLKQDLGQDEDRTEELRLILDA